MISPSDIIDSECYQLIKDYITCDICKGVIINPYRCKECEKSYCKTCIETWAKNNRKCPSGCFNFQSREHRFLKELLKHLKFKCRLNCGKELDYSEYYNHLEYECPNIDFEKQIENEKKKLQDIENQNILIYTLINTLKRKSTQPIFPMTNHPKSKRRNSTPPISRSGSISPSDSVELE